MCTSFSTAWRAASCGVAKSGPMSTSKPRSAKAEAITFWPRSWPSWPILATRMRGLRPSRAGEGRRQIEDAPHRCVLHADLPFVDAGDRPRSRRGGARRPFRAQVKSRRRSPWRAPPSPKARGGCPSPISPALVSSASAAATARGSRSALSLASFSSCWARTAELSTLRMSIAASSVGLKSVHADDLLRAGIDARLRFRRGLLDAHLGQALARSPSPCRRAARPRRYGRAPWRRDPP